MLVQVRYGAHVVLALLAGAALAGCGTADRASRGLASAFSPYRVEVVQGNFVSREQVEALQPGMSRQQVRDVLGTPLITSLFHHDRWDYVFTIQRPGVEVQTRRLSVYFKGDAFERSEGDEMPTEAEFVASLSGKRGKARVPVLEATEEQLARYPARSRAEAAQAARPEPSAAGPVSYPPLEK